MNDACNLVTKKETHRFSMSSATVQPNRIQNHK